MAVPAPVAAAGDTDHADLSAMSEHAIRHWHHDLNDLRAAARRRLPRLIFDFIQDGARDETTLRDNRRAFDAWHLMPRVGVDVSRRRLGTTLLGRSMALPLVLGPTGLAGLYRPRGEMLACRAATTAGIPFCLFTNSIASIEAVAADVPDSDRWFQPDPLRDRDLMADMLQRAWDHGYRTLCFTVDLPVQGRRERDIRNGFHAAPCARRSGRPWDVLRRPAWFWGLARNPVSFGNFACHRGTSRRCHYHCPARGEPVRSLGRLGPDRPASQGLERPVRGQGRAASGRRPGCRACECGRGDRLQPWRPPAGHRAGRPARPCRVSWQRSKGEAEILLDSGVRRGSDILKALALGARACIIGRPFLWGLAAGGEAGVRRAIEILAAELDEAMALAGMRDLAELTPDFVRARAA